MEISTMATNKDKFEASLAGMLYFIRMEKGFDGKHKYPVVMKNAFTPNGKYIGHIRLAHRLTRMHGVTPCREAVGPTCHMGKSSSDGKWYGWNPKFYYGFGIGDVLRAESPVGHALHLEHDTQVASDKDAKYWAHTLGGC
jgi:hypothetical protein